LPAGHVGICVKNCPVGGGREALAEPDSTWGTTDEAIAEALFAARVTELGEASGTGRSRRREALHDSGRPGTGPPEEEAQGRQDVVVAHGGPGTATSALEHFGSKRDPRTIEPGDVRKWTEALAEGGKRKPGTVRHYLNALSGLYGRAQERLFVGDLFGLSSEWLGE
jgi:hypothetical protein